VSGLGPLTVGFHEPQFLADLGAENRDLASTAWYEKGIWVVIGGESVYLGMLTVEEFYAILDQPVPGSETREEP